MYASGWSCIREKLYHLAHAHTARVFFASPGSMFLGSFAVSAQQPAPRRESERMDSAAEADKEKNPFAGDAKAVAAGKELYSRTASGAMAPAARATVPTRIRTRWRTWI